MKKIIDERQELEMMKVERTGFWIMWGVLLLSCLLYTSDKEYKNPISCVFKPIF